jgi:hypothetical protein
MRILIFCFLFVFSSCENNQLVWNSLELKYGKKIDYLSGNQSVSYLSAGLLAGKIVHLKSDPDGAPDQIFFHTSEDKLVELFVNYNCEVEQFKEICFEDEQYVIEKKFYSSFSKPVDQAFIFRDSHNMGSQDYICLNKEFVLKVSRGRSFSFSLKKINCNSDKTELRRIMI